jgi:hypothetical protein
LGAYISQSLEGKQGIEANIKTAENLVKLMQNTIKKFHYRFNNIVDFKNTPEYG